MVTQQPQLGRKMARKNNNNYKGNKKRGKKTSIGAGHRTKYSKRNAKGKIKKYRGQGGPRKSVKRS